jgi:hypothetical protein
MSKAKRTPTPEMALEQSRDWVEASIFQGDRLMRHLASQVEDPTNPKDWSREKWVAYNQANFLPGGSILEFYEGFFFIVAARQAKRWLGLAVPLWPALASDVQAFERETTYIEEARDMLTHEDEYLIGAGKEPQNYRRSVPGVHPETSAHALVAGGNGQYWLGGRVSVPDTMKALRALHPKLAELSKTLPSK